MAALSEIRVFEDQDQDKDEDKDEHEDDYTHDIHDPAHSSVPPTHQDDGVLDVPEHVEAGLPVIPIKGLNFRP